jgi:signal transduction histidine kinase
MSRTTYDPAAPAPHLGLVTPPPPPDPATSGLLSPAARRIGTAWVVVSVPAIALTARWLTTPDRYIVGFVLLAAVAYTIPTFGFGWQVIRQAPGSDVTGFKLLYAGLTGIKVVGTGLLLLVVTDWTWLEGGFLLPAVIVTGVCFCAGVGVLVRSRSGRRTLTVDVVEAASSVVAVVAPLIVVWGPSVLDAEVRWFAIGSAIALLFALWATYWGTLLLVRLGPGRDGLDLCCAGLCGFGALDAGLNVAQGVTGFDLPAPPLLAVHAMTFSMIMLIPLWVPKRMRPGQLGQLPPQAQVRGARIATGAVVAGVAALLTATIALHEQRDWAVAFSLGAVSVLILLAALRQLLATEETRRLYAEVEVASEQRRRLLGQLLERSLQDRRRFAGQLYEQAMAAYASFHVLAGAGQSTRTRFGNAKHPASSPAVAAASARVSGELARNAESVRGLVLAIKPADDERNLQARLGIPITAYLETLYDNRPTPNLTFEAAPSLSLGWIAETVLLQVIQEALHNVWEHSRATAVDVTITTTDAATVLRVSDDGRGFDPGATAERSGFATMRAAVAVVGGSLLVDATPGEGTTVTARLANDA